MRGDRERFKAYVTKYALSLGMIEEIDAETCFHISPTMIRDVNYSSGIYHGKDWHRSMSEALARAEEMRLAKIESHRKSIAKLDKLRFSGVTP